jgi:hypothetical protein
MNVLTLLTLRHCSGRLTQCQPQLDELGGQRAVRFCRLPDGCRESSDRLGRNWSLCWWRDRPGLLSVVLRDRCLFGLIRTVLRPGSPFCGRRTLNYLGCRCLGGKDDLPCLSLRLAGAVSSANRWALTKRLPISRPVEDSGCRSTTVVAYSPLRFCGSTTPEPLFLERRLITSIFQPRVQPTWGFSVYPLSLLSTREISRISRLWLGGLDSLAEFIV